MKNKLIGLLMLLALSSSCVAQGLTKQVILDAMEGRNVDRHLKTMINMVAEIDELSAQNETYRLRSKLLENRVNAQEGEISHQSGVISTLQEAEAEAIDSLNAYKVTSYGQSIQINDLITLVIEPMKEDAKRQRRRETWKDIIIGFLLTTLGGFAGAIIF